MTPGTTAPSALAASDQASIDASVREVDAKVRDILQKPVYRFCREPAYPWTLSESAWCGIDTDPYHRCQAMIGSCRVEEKPVSQRARPTRSGETAEEPEPSAWRLPSPGLGVLAAVAVAAIVALIVRAIGRHTVDSRNLTRGDKPSAQQGEPVHEPGTIADVESLLAESRRAAAQGRFADGIAAAYAALLRQLEGDRLIRLHPSRTNGDFLRELAPRAELCESVRAIVGDVERVQFGERPATAEQFESVFRHVSALVEDRAARVPLAARAVITLLVAALAIALGSCSAVPPGRGAPEDSPSGTSAVLELLRLSGFESRLRIRALAKLEAEEQIVVLAGARLDEKSTQELFDWMDAGGTLILANGDSSLSTLLDVKFAEGKASGRPNLRVEGPLRSRAGNLLVVIPGVNKLVIPDALAHWDLLVHGGDDVYAAGFRHGAGQAIVLADGQLFTNASLAIADNAALLTHLFDPAKKKIAFLGELTGNGARTPMESVEASKLGPTFWHLLVLLFVFYLYKGFPFGTLSDPPPAAHRSFVEHVRALGLLYARARASAHARSVYGAYALERLRASMLGAPRGLSALAEGIAARTGRPLGLVMVLLVEAKQAREDEGQGEGASSQEDLDLVRRLSRLLQQVRGGSA